MHHSTDEDTQQMCAELEAHLKKHDLWCADMESVIAVLREEGLHRLCHAHKWNMGQTIIYYLLVLQQHAGLMEFGGPDEGPRTLLRQMLFVPTAQASRDAVEDVLHQSPHTGAAFFGAVSGLLSNALQMMVAAHQMADDGAKKANDDTDKKSSDADKKEDDAIKKEADDLPKNNLVPEATGLEAIEMMRKSVKAR
jgi:hypothetical protein